MQNKVSKVITHNGVFHADETLAIATLIVFYNKDIRIERRGYVTEEELQDENIIVLDIGGVYYIFLNNYDHHQDANLPATNILVLDNFCKDGKLVTLLKKRLFDYVSDVDKNGKGHFAGYNAIVSSFNNLPDGFEKAVNLGVDLINSIVEIHRKEQAETKLILSGDVETVMNGKVCILREGFISTWKSWYKMAIYQSVRDGKWCLESSNSDLYKIPNLKKQNGQLFHHNAGFFATYSTIEEAIAHCLTITI